jgi:general stress protein 26
MYIIGKIESSNIQFNGTTQSYREQVMINSGRIFRQSPRKWMMLCLVLLFCGWYALVSAQQTSGILSRDSMLVAARDMMTLNKYCALITTDQAGRIEARTMNPFAPDENMVVWFATHRQSRKVKAILNNPQVCLYYAEHAEAIGYVCLTGLARIVDDREILLEKKREYWEGIPDWQDVMVLIEVIPQRIDIIYYKYGLVNGPDGWQAPYIEFDVPQSEQ